MAPSIGLNLRVTGHCNQGGRKYMEDVFSVAYQQTEDEMDLEYAFFGIFDGHGGKEAALFAKEHLMDNITKQQNFWSENDDLVLKSIREGFLKTQQDMWGDLENWAKTGSGLPSTAGTTASIAFIRRGKIFVGHVGDSGIVLGEQDEERPDVWNCKPLTKDHKPECEVELARIEAAGGKVVNKSGVPRVVWNRPRLGHTGPVRRSTPVDEIPFLAVARALGDLWSYNSKRDIFVVSPDPDLHVYSIDISKQRCLILGTDGAWNVLSPEMAVNSVRLAEKNNEKHMLEGVAGGQWLNPSKQLVDQAVDRWRACKLRADNTSVVVVMLDPPGPPRAQVLRRQRDAAKGIHPPKKQACNNTDAPPLPPKPAAKPNKGLAIISRFPNSKKPEEASGKNLVTAKEEGSTTPTCKLAESSRIVHDSAKTEPTKVSVAKPNRPDDPTVPAGLKTAPESAAEPEPSTSSSSSSSSSSTSEPDIQVNEVSSSDTESPTPLTKSQSVPKVAPRKSLSRELASLALSSPAPALPVKGRKSSSRQSSNPVMPRRRGRSIDGAATGRENESDEENSGVRAGGRNTVPVVRSHRSGAAVQTGRGALQDGTETGKLQEVEAKCEALSTKLKMMERKVADKTEQLSQEVKAIKTVMGTSTPTRVLRSRNGDSAPTPGSGTKRKRGEVEEVKGNKRERTTTWGGLVGGKSRMEKSTRVTRKSTGGALVSRGRRSLNILKK